MLCLLKVELSLRKKLWLTLKYISSRDIFLYLDLVILLYGFFTVVLTVFDDFAVAFGVRAAANVEQMHDKLASYYHEASIGGCGPLFDACFRNK